MSDNNNSHNRLTTQILLMLLSALFGVFATQLFHSYNKKSDSRVELKKELLKDQHAKLNRILNFAYRYEEFHIIYETVYIDPYTGQEYTHENIGNSEQSKWIDLPAFAAVEEHRYERINLPAFVADEKYRDEFNKTLNVIINEKDLVDHKIAVKIDEMVYYLQKHPIPASFDKDELKNCEWSKKQVRDGWVSILHSLYDETNNVINEL